MSCAIGITVRVQQKILNLLFICSKEYFPATIRSLKLIGRSIFESETGNQNIDGQMHGQTDALTGTNIESNLA